MGRIVVLNGPSSAGKSTLAHAVRDSRRNTLCVRIDDLYRSAGGNQPNDWSLFSALTRATFATAASFAQSGFDVVVDTVFERAECLAMAYELLDAPVLVAVVCPLAVLEERELARGDRRSGQAREQHQRVLHDATYALTIDTHATPLGDCVARVSSLFDI